MNQWTVIVTYFKKKRLKRISFDFEVDFSLITKGRDSNKMFLRKIDGIIIYDKSISALTKEKYIKE